MLPLNEAVMQIVIGGSFCTNCCACRQRGGLTVGTARSQRDARENQKASKH
jgi:hypothetical protein